MVVLQAASQLIDGGLAQQLLATNSGPMGSAPEAHGGDRGCFGGGAAGSGTRVHVDTGAETGAKGLKGKGKGKNKDAGPRTQTKKVTLSVHMLHACRHEQL